LLSGLIIPLSIYFIHNSNVFFVNELARMLVNVNYLMANLFFVIEAKRIERF